MESTRPLTKLMREALAVIADAKNGEITGQSIATWMLRRTRGWAGVREALKGLERRNLVVMHRHDDGGDFPDRRRATFSINKETFDALQKRT